MDLHDFDEALADRPADERWELIEGRLVRRPAGTRADHARIVQQLTVRLMDAIDIAGVDLEVFRETFYLRSDRFNSALLPDVMVVADRFQPGAKAATEPVIVIEVASIGTIGRDWWEKRLAYKRFSSLQHYALVLCERPCVQTFDRSGTAWTTRVVEGLDAAFAIPTIGVSLPLRDIYARVFA